MNAALYDVCVSGGGAVARALALALSGQGWRVALAASQPVHAGQQEDVRTYALNARSVALLGRLRIWPQLQQFAAPVYEMRIRGDEGGDLRFSAWQQRVGELAWIADAAALDRLLAEALRFAPHVTLVPPVAEAPVQAHLLAVCEGKHSATRDALGVSWSRRDYGHWGVAARLQAGRPHAGVARQWFRRPDVLALLPFNQPQPGASYGMVWSLPEACARQLLALPPAEFERALTTAIGERDPEALAEIGRLTLTAPPASWPLALAHPDRWSGPGWVLVGDAAHQVHPLAGQGLNLGLADVDTLVDVLARARQDEPWRLPGDERVLRRYARARWLPTHAMAGVTDGLLHLFEHDQAPWRELRNTGMGLLDRITPLKRWLIGHALDA